MGFDPAENNLNWLAGLPLGTFFKCSSWSWIQV